MTPRPPRPELPVVELTTAQQQLLDLNEEVQTKLDALRVKYKTERERLRAEVPKCKSHVWILPPNAEYRWFHNRWVIDEWVHCAICKKDGGWFCPDNPKRRCKYEATDYMRDSCIYCGNPEERK